MIVIGIAGGFIAGMAVLAVMVGIGTSAWWHRRYHQDGLRLGSCDHCSDLWQRGN